MDMITPQLQLLQKYDFPTPRYTSYPTIPVWKGILPNQWHHEFKKALNKENSLSLYIHVPFCKSLCSFCGCNKMITNDRSLADQFINALHLEFSFYEKMIPFGTKLVDIHLGGGSPSWLTSLELKRLLSPILNSPKLIIDKNQFDQSIELDPRTTSSDHCEQLSSLGFNRVSLGIQDLNSDVLDAIKRTQSVELIQEIINSLTKNNLQFINLDLIYGLPLQTVETMSKTIEKIVELKPTRIALYSYAHVPSLKPAQKLLEKFNLPTAEEKILIQQKATLLLKKAGYKEIGMDHFALPEDPLFQANQNKKMHRNFMGYTTRRSEVLLGLGPSSLSDTWSAFAQNEKDYRKWHNDIMKQQYSIIHGHKLSKNELNKREKILELMCQFKTTLKDSELTPHQQTKLHNLINDKIILRNKNEYFTTELGKHFIRNICHAIDDYA